MGHQLSDVSAIGLASGADDDPVGRLAVDHASLKDPDYREGDWGPAYLVCGDSADMGVVRLRPGDAMPNHIHRFCDESFVVIEGTASLWVEASTRIHLDVDQVVRCAPGEMHYLVNDSDAVFRCVFIKSPSSPGDTEVIPWEPGEPVPTVATGPAENRT
ncbi:MAG: cupin domain-containing protein [Nitriliruptor sp.]|nr:MAG: cupin domain-containing protein [Nitriliruptor sp.]